MKSCPHCRASAPADADFCPECGSPLAAPTALPTLGGLETLAGDSGAAGATATLAPGDRFADRYTIEQQVGAGGMGVVYRAQDAVTKRTVALKLIRPERVAGARDLERLVQEGITARDIRHANVVAVYDVGESAGQPFLSMELLEGRSLRDWHRAQRQAGRDVPWKVAARVVLEIAAGLEAAHAAGVVHRDLKPENVVLLGEPSAERAPLKLLDFGIARAAGAGGEGARSLGTPHYMAPEQVTSPDLAGPEADLYSLSVLFYELLVDVLPQGHWQPPSGGRAEVPTALDDLIERGLSNRPANRPRTAREYADVVSRSLDAGLGTRALDELRRHMDRGRRRKMTKRQAWLAGGILGVAGIASYLTEQGPGGAPPPDGREHEIDPDETIVHPFAPLCGSWADGFGGGFQVVVDPVGGVHGQGVSPDGYPLTLEGTLDGRRFEYRLGLNGMVAATGSGRWDGREHLTYRTKNLDGSPNLSGRFHVNHLEGPACD